MAAIHRRRTSSSRTGFTSRIGVPSSASRWWTSIRRPSMAVIVTRWRPIGLGRCGERVLKTPSRCRAVSPRGCKLKTSRRPRSSQVMRMISSPGRRLPRLSHTSASKTSQAGGAPSSACFGAAPGSVSGDSTRPICFSSKFRHVLLPVRQAASGNTGARRTASAICYVCRSRFERRPRHEEDRRAQRCPTKPGNCSATS